MLQLKMAWRFGQIYINVWHKPIGMSDCHERVNFIQWVLNLNLFDSFNGS